MQRSAAIPGLIDLLSLPKGIKRIGLMHMGLNLTLVVLYAVNAWLRIHRPSENTIWLSAITIGLPGVSGWLGGKMVYAHGWRSRRRPNRLRDYKMAAVLT